MKYLVLLLALSLAACDGSDGGGSNSAQGANQKLECSETVLTTLTAADGSVTQYEGDAHWVSMQAVQQIDSTKQNISSSVSYENTDYYLADGVKNFSSKNSYTSTSKKSMTTTILDNGNKQIETHIAYTRNLKLNGRDAGHDSREFNAVEVFQVNGTTSKQISEVVDGVTQEVYDYVTETTTYTDGSKKEVTTLHTPFTDKNGDDSYTTTSDTISCLTTNIAK
jgi:hypothetical protein